MKPVKQVNRSTEAQKRANTVKLEKERIAVTEEIERSLRTYVKLGGKAKYAKRPSIFSRPHVWKYSDLPK